MKNVAVVTGGAGFIGHHLVNSLCKDTTVVVLDNYVRGVASRLKDIGENLILKDCDITKYEQIELALREYNVVEVYHLAAINGTDNFYKIPIDIMNVGILGCINILKFMKEFNCKIGVFASSAEVYQDCDITPTPEDIPLIIPDVKNPRYSYGLSKIFTEYYSYHYGLKYNLDISIFRPHNVYGPNMGLKHVIPEFIMEFLKNPSEKKIVDINAKGPLESTRAFCHVDDIIRGLNLLKKFNKGVNVYNIGNIHVISMYQLLKEISGILNVDFKIVNNINKHTGSTLHRCPNIEKAKKLGFNPVIDIKSGLTETVSWYKAHFLDLMTKKNSVY